MYKPNQQTKREYNDIQLPDLNDPKEMDLAEERFINALISLPQIIERLEQSKIISPKCLDIQFTI